MLDQIPRAGLLLRSHGPWPGSHERAGRLRVDLQLRQPGRVRPRSPAPSPAVCCGHVCVLTNCAIPPPSPPRAPVSLPPVPKILQQSPDLLVQLQPVPTSPATPDAFNLLCWGIRGGLGDGAPPKHAFALQHRRALYRPSAGKLDISRVLWSAESRLSPSMFSIGLGGGAVGLVALASTGGCPDRPTLFPSSVVLMRFDIPTAFQVSPSLSAGPRPGPLLRAPGRPAGPRRFGPASALSVTAILSSHMCVPMPAWPPSALSLI